MSEQKNDIPLVRLGDVASYLRPGDRLRHENGSECTIATASEKEVHTGGLALNMDGLFTLISPRLELVPVGGVIKAGTPWAPFYDGGFRASFDPGEAVVRDDSDPTWYQLIRDEPERLPRDVVAGPETLPRRVLGKELRVGDRFRFVACDFVVEENARRWNEDSVDANGFVVARTGEFDCATEEGFGVHECWTVELLSRANQDPPAAEAQPEAVAPKQPAACCWCNQPFWAGRLMVDKSEGEGYCGDCCPGPEPLDARIATARRELAEAAPDPHAHLTPAQRYHLNDDPDASGIPEGN